MPERDSDGIEQGNARRSCELSMFIYFRYETRGSNMHEVPNGKGREKRNIHLKRSHLRHDLAE
jgi:hypothetical protein